jgi:hypothetical protein
MHREIKKKFDTHIVIKNEDIETYLSEKQREELDYILCTIGVGRVNDDKSGCNSYYVCNTDEPYAEKVLQTILKGEAEKEDAYE